MQENTVNRVCIIIGYTLALFVFIKNMWMSDDAYIMFRTIEQIFAGNGAVWNPMERVQVYTSALWFWIIVLFRFFSSDLFIITNLVSLIFFLLTLFTVQKILKSGIVFLLAVFIMTLSKGFYDFTSGGLENPLSYFLIALYIYNFKLLYQKSGSINKHLLAMIWLFGLMLLTRHDHSTLFFVPTLLLIIYNRKLYSISKWIVIIFLALSPFILWSLFSTFYYGIPIPNTALAKLNTGISKDIVLYSGVKSYAAYLLLDFLTVFTCVYAVIKLYLTKDKLLRAFSYGITLNMFYILYIGGDFMLGRFLSFAFLTSLLLVLIYIHDFRKIILALISSIDRVSKNYAIKDLSKNDQKKALIFFVILLLYAVLYPRVPLMTPTDYSYQGSIGMVVEERGYYFKYASLWTYLETKETKEIFPKHVFSEFGKKLSESTDSIGIHGNIGFYGYHAGLDNYIIDQWALSDPLLSRLLANPRQIFRTGHVGRDIPEGYLETIKTGQPSFYDNDLNKFYKKLYLVVRSNELFAWERLKTIIEMNFGKYDHLLEKHNRKVLNKGYPAWGGYDNNKME